MIILTIRTDKPAAEIGLFDNTKQLAYERFEAHRSLAETLDKKIADLLASQQQDWQDIQGIICFQGPGSFTGLRIGLTVANALSYSLGIPIVAEMSEAWIAGGQKRLQKGDTDGLALPEYGAPVHITKPKS